MDSAAFATIKPTLGQGMKHHPLNRPMIYVACYYTANPTHGLHAAAAAFDALYGAGWCPVVPHTNMTLDAITPRPSEFWYGYDLALLARCDAMYVCEDALTSGSHGVLAEIEFCEAHAIPVVYTLGGARNLCATLAGLDPWEGAADA